MTPRFNPDVNGYWMCDIGRFDYHWVEGEARLRRPMMRSGGALEPAGWHDVQPKVRDRLQEAIAASSVRFLVSAHAAIEELFVLKQVVEGLLGVDGLKSTTVTWTRTKKPQPEGIEVQGAGHECPERQRRARSRLRRRPGQRWCRRSERAPERRRGRTRQGAVRDRSGPGRLAWRRRHGWLQHDGAVRCRF